MNNEMIKEKIEFLEKSLLELKELVIEEKPEIKLSNYTDYEGNLIPAYNIETEFFDTLLKQTSSSNIADFLWGNYEVGKHFMETLSHFRLDDLLIDLLDEENYDKKMEIIVYTFVEELSVEETFLFLHLIITNLGLDPKPFL